MSAHRWYVSDGGPVGVMLLSVHDGLARVQHLVEVNGERHEFQLPEADLHTSWLSAKKAAMVRR